MSYLQPPPNMSPVVVVKDYGGYVDQYAAATENYRRTGREVRIHECHSACTMALSLPNVCVYRDSVFKFHQAYDPRNHITNYAVSDQLFATYPEAVRDRLGTLTKQFTVMRGQELIDLGVRDCNAPEPRIMIAQAKVRPLPDGATTGSSTFAALTGKLQGMVPGLGAKPQPVSPTGAKPPRPAPPDVPAGMLAPKIPLPPERPVEIATAAPNAPEQAAPTVPAPQAPQDVTPADGIPLPPPRPKVLVAYVPSLKPIPYLQRIAGSAAILPPRFIPFPRHPA
ncbi:hypothetical protein RHAL1_03881 [Beijerinckiaceae bacterium RH AL1]|nr:hypothetical protein [Beijerinckiaceae bacterium]VVB49519.1 hypothetical protein RHCH11_RHCH11_03805 [Beijerinckiaceae bacterium RH CH11]VVB49599.1 hypothetical protein RHAL8_03801 [Beijerinckiaceae bacterium RH AL8]VVC56945.1 hypothetical protein RHAL1_03881 [Beijerinckiaceae bacterium RH AL1]